LYTIFPISIYRAELNELVEFERDFPFVLTSVDSQTSVWDTMIYVSVIGSLNHTQQRLSLSQYFSRYICLVLQAGMTGAAVLLSSECQPMDRIFGLTGEMGRLYSVTHMAFMKLT
jgi:hypothetical protein